MTRIEKIDNSIIVEHNGSSYLFPKNSVMFLSSPMSSMVNIMVGGKTNLLAIHNDDIVNHSNTAVETVVKLNNDIYN